MAQGVEPIFSYTANSSIIDLVDELIKTAHAKRASDIHIDPTFERVEVRLRIDGILHDVDPLPGSVRHELISRIKILCGLRTDEHQAAQDGRFRLVVEG